MAYDLVQSNKYYTSGCANINFDLRAKEMIVPYATSFFLMSSVNPLGNVARAGPVKPLIAVIGHQRDENLVAICTTLAPRPPGSGHPTHPFPGAPQRVCSPETYWTNLTTGITTKATEPRREQQTYILKGTAVDGEPGCAQSMTATATTEVAAATTSEISFCSNSSPYDPSHNNTVLMCFHVVVDS
ncbi:hypothetical protein B0H19DRAFT_1061119 [Mycena capillaripes]|nr:hypothetical protein B0H19DRAFT_1061119 [Mycena capillaripes]